MSDLISRKALCDYALNQKDKSVTPNDIMRFPSAQPERKKGKWLNNDASGYHFYGKCSECEQEFCVDAWYTQNMNYCPNCGCRMERAKNEQKK